MKNIFVTSLFIIACSLLPSNYIQAFTLQDAVLAQNMPLGINMMVPAKDGKSYYELSDDGSRILKKDYRSGDIIETVFDAKTARDCDIEYWEGFQFSENEDKILLYTNKKPIYRYSFKADYYVYGIRHNKLQKLSNDGGEEIAVFSPNGRMVAYVKDNNVFVAKLDYGTNIAATKDGEKNKIINGVPDWVYQEEFGLLSSLTWSPDNLMLAFIRWDETNVPLYSMQQYENDDDYSQLCYYPQSFEYKYPVAGRENSIVSVKTYDVETRVLKTMELPVTEDSYIPRMTFTNDPTRLIITTLNRTQNRLQIHAANPRSTVTKLLYQEESKSWIDESILDKIKFYDDAIIVLSDKNGYAHLYKYSTNGAFSKQLTDGKWNVTEYYGYDPVRKVHYIQTTQDGPLNRVLAKVDDRTGKITKLTDGNGTYSAEFNSSFDYFVMRFSNAQTPDQYTICNYRGEKIRELEMNESYAGKYASTEIPKKEFFTMESNGVTLNGYMIKPIDFDPSKKYPVIMSQYSGPGSQQVLNAWKIDWENYFATQGYIIACVDGRGTGGRSKDFSSIVYMNLGKYESIDQLAAAEYMAQLPYVDSEKIGIWGWSYGGYETLMAMSQPGSKYAAGVAIAPVTDWRLYDTIYSERYMRTPQENESGYKAASPIERAQMLNGRLLIMTGTADDNVHQTNTLNYVSKLFENDKLVNMVVFPNKNHSITGGNTRCAVYSHVLDFYNTHLK